METKNNWVSVFTSSKPYLIEMAKQLLEDAGYDVQIMNKQDSSYLIGYIYIYVPEQDAEACHKLIARFKLDLNLE